MADIEFNQEQRYLSIEYPGFQVNAEKALKTLGGIEHISKIYNNPSQRLELRFRPDDVYCKPLCGDRFTTSNLLLKVIKRRRKNAKPSEMDVSYETKILGIIDTTYRFQSLTDFQFLPMLRKGNEYEPLLEKLVPKKVYQSDWLKQEIPIFIPPPIFTRMDSPIEYMYRESTSTKTIPENPENLIGVWRQRRTGFAIFLYFDDQPIPMRPVPGAVEHIKASKFIEEEKVAKMKKLFEERPIWSKMALMGAIDIPREKLKSLLPYFAYYFLTGPWRSLWVKFGYDPRKDPSAKKYQILDFRVRQRSSVDKLVIHSKRSSFGYNLPNTVSKNVSQAATIQTHALYGDPKNISSSNVKAKTQLYSFQPGVIPPFRQMFYQLCDIHVPEVQQLISSNDGKETVCIEKDGWCIENIQDKCRAILSSYLKDITEREFQESVSTSKKPFKMKTGESDSSDQDSSENEMATEILEYMQE